MKPSSKVRSVLSVGFSKPLIKSTWRSKPEISKTSSVKELNGSQSTIKLQRKNDDEKNSEQTVIISKEGIKISKNIKNYVKGEPIDLEFKTKYKHPEQHQTFLERSVSSSTLLNRFESNEYINVKGENNANEKLNSNHNNNGPQSLYMKKQENGIKYHISGSKNNGQNGVKHNAQQCVQLSVPQSVPQSVQHSGQQSVQHNGYIKQEENKPIKIISTLRNVYSAKSITPVIKKKEFFKKEETLSQDVKRSMAKVLKIYNPQDGEILNNALSSNRSIDNNHNQLIKNEENRVEERKSNIYCTPGKEISKNDKQRYLEQYQKETREIKEEYEEKYVEEVNEIREHYKLQLQQEPENYIHLFKKEQCNLFSKREHNYYEGPNKEYKEHKYQEPVREYECRSLPNRLDFLFIRPIGEGGYGTVWHVQSLRTQRHFALKEMSKAVIVSKKSVDNVLNEKRILENLSHPFISNIIGAFHDRDNVYLLMDLLSNGDLRTRMSTSSRFTEQQTKFIVGCILIAIEYMHGQRVFHRDIKPENLVLDENNYVRVTDFGIARMEHSKQLLDASGTPGYMAPEVLCKQIHKYEVDYYALGIITYELVTGRRPFPGNNRVDIRNAILTKQHMLKKSEVPSGWGIDVVDFTNKLLIRVPQQRLGARGAKEVKMHPWLAKIDWKEMESKNIASPLPDKKVNYEISIKKEDECIAQYTLLQRIEKKVDPFTGYMCPMKK